MDPLEDEILELWRLLHKHHSKYIMVGGFACSLHGFNRMTEDLDLWIEDTVENRKSLRQVFKDLGLGDLEGIETSEFVPGYTSIRLNSGIELDLMTYLSGLTQLDFKKCYEFAPIADIDGIEVRFLHLNQLIEAKRASGRPKDLIDIEELEKIRKMQSGHP